MTMTKHIRDRIETILHNGGDVLTNLRKLVDVLEDIRSVESINNEFVESFTDIENRRGVILPKIKSGIFSYINCTEKYNFVNNYDGKDRTIL